MTIRNRGGLFPARIAWEIFSDFSIGLNVTERFDSAPPSLTLYLIVGANLVYFVHRAVTWQAPHPTR